MLWLLLCVFIGAGEIEQDGEDSRISDRQTPIQPGHGRQLSRRTPGGWTSEHDHNMSDGHIVPPPAGYREGPHPVISGTSSNLLISLLIVNCSNSDPLFSLIILIYVSVIFLYMFFAFCWYDGMPIATFSTLPERGGRTRRKTTYKRFVYPYPEDLRAQSDYRNINGQHNPSHQMEMERLNDKTKLHEKVRKMFVNIVSIIVCLVNHSSKLNRVW